MQPRGDSTARRPRSTTPRLAGTVLALAGIVLLIIGWWGISGESIVSRQLPYLASASIPGAALLIAGAVLVAGGRQRPTDDRVEVLYALLTEPLASDATSVTPTDGGLVSVSGGTRSHRADCALVAGKPTTAVTDPAGLPPCPVCQPGP